MNIIQTADQFFMRSAYREAELAYEEDEVPVGALISSGQVILARGHNQVIRLNDPTAHAEMIAITAACNYLGSRYLNDCTLYVTLEPCPMCAAAMAWAQLGRLVYGASDPERGYSKIESNLLHPKAKVVSGIMQNECTGLLEEFFKKMR